MLQANRKVQENSCAKAYKFFSSTNDLNRWAKNWPRSALTTTIYAEIKLQNELFQAAPPSLEAIEQSILSEHFSNHHGRQLHNTDSG